MEFEGVIVFDLKITGGTVVDGTGADRFQADVAVRDGKIVEIRRRIAFQRARRHHCGRGQLRSRFRPGKAG